MQIFSDSAELNKFNQNIQKTSQLAQNNDLIAGSNFQKVLQNHISGAPVESAMISTNSDIKKKRKDSEEILEEYSEIAEETYDVLAAEKRIRQLFRKLRIGENDAR